MLYHTPLLILQSMGPGAARHYYTKGWPLTRSTNQRIAADVEFGRRQREVIATFLFFFCLRIVVYDASSNPPSILAAENP